MDVVQVGMIHTCSVHVSCNEWFLYHHYPVDMVLPHTFLVYFKSQCLQTIPEFWIYTSSPEFGLVFPVLKRECVVDHSDTDSRVNLVNI